MKILHLADLHIGLKLYKYDLTEDQLHIFRQIADKAEMIRPDAIVIAGDLYDKSIPAAESVELFDTFVKMLTDAAPDAHIMMISGNHDSGVRINVFRKILEQRLIHMIGLPPSEPEEQIEKVTLTDEFGNVNFYLLPFVKPSMVKKITGSDENGNNLSYDASLRKLLARENINSSERNILVSHQFYLPAGTDPDKIERAESEIKTVGNIDEVRSDVLAPFDYAALGHIHRKMKAGSGNFWYAGTPLACSMSEAGQEKGMMLVTLKEKGDICVESLPLEPLRYVRDVKGTLDEVTDKESDDFVRVTLTDLTDLDVIDMQERLHRAFPHLLEVRRENAVETDYSMDFETEEELDPFSLCCRFMPNMSEEQKSILADVINKVQDGSETKSVPADAAGKVRNGDRSETKSVPGETAEKVQGGDEA